jgi:hypothetical protein
LADALLAALDTATKREAECHDIISALWSCNDPAEAERTLMARIHRVLGMESADADCENHICKQLSDLQHQLDTATKEKEPREWKSIDRWVTAHSMSSAPESTASDHYYIDGFNAGLREAAQMWKEERERWAVSHERAGSVEQRLASLAEGIQKYGRHSDECPVGRDAKFPRCACGHSKSNHRHPSIEAPGCRFCRCETFTARGDLSCTCGLSALLASSEAT